MKKNKLTKFLIIATVLLALVHIRFNTIFEDRFLGLTVDINHGVCVDDEQNGLEYIDGMWDSYTSYKYTDAQKGDEFITAFIYNPFSLGFDDISVRIDYNKSSKSLFVYAN